MSLYCSHPFPISLRLHHRFVDAVNAMMDILCRTTDVWSLSAIKQYFEAVPLGTLKHTNVSVALLDGITQIQRMPAFLYPLSAGPVIWKADVQVVTISTIISVMEIASLTATFRSCLLDVLIGWQTWRSVLVAFLTFTSGIWKSVYKYHRSVRNMMNMETAFLA